MEYQPRSGLNWKNTCSIKIHPVYQGAEIRNLNYQRERGVPVLCTLQIIGMAVCYKYYAALPLESLKDSTLIATGKRSATFGSQ